MSHRGQSRKTVTDHSITLERAMVTRHYMMSWDLDRCVGCQIGPLVCPKGSVIYKDAILKDGRIEVKPSIDIDTQTCVLCGICVVACPTNAVSITINGKPEIPVVDLGAFPELIKSTEFSRDLFDWSSKEFVINNCPSNVISYDIQADTLVVDQAGCIHCRQCEIASKGAFTVQQPWQGSVVLHSERCVEGCLACADICPTRALHVDENGRLALADYYCIKCGSCMHVCPIKPEFEKVAYTFESQGLTLTREFERLTNENQLAIKVERWRVNHKPVSSAAWVEALRKLSDDKAKMVEMDRTRALRRKDLIMALRGYVLPPHQEGEPNG